MFYYTLAENLGYCSVNKMLESVTSEELSEWQAYYIQKENDYENNKTAENAKQRAKKQGR